MSRIQALGAVDLRDQDGLEVSPVTAQPKRLALLVYLAAARPRGFHRRDTLVGLFWPESSETRARGALGQALYFLRRSLGNDVIVGRGQEDVAVAPDRLWCDAAALHDALEANDVSAALELYRGDLLPGFFLQDAPGFQEWLDRERTYLRRVVLEAASARAATLEASDGRAAAALLRRALEIAPEDEGALRRLMRLLDGCGERAAALAAFDAVARNRATAAESSGVSPPEPTPPALVTRSLAALRAYWEGERAVSQDRWRDAAEHFAHAIALDSTYWFAYWRNGYARMTVEAPVEESVRLTYEAHRFGFPERDRLLIETRMADSLSERLTLHRQLTQRYPDYWLGWWDYANRLVHDAPLLGSTHDDARAALERTLALRPNDVSVLQHLFWMAAQDVDVPAMEHVVQRIHDLRAESRGFTPSRPDYLRFLEMILAAARGDEAALAVAIDSNIADLIENVPGDAGDVFAMGLGSYGYHRAELEFSGRLLESPASPQLKGAMRRALAMTWAARGAWDSAFVAGQHYAAAVEGTAPLQHMFRMYAAGEWLGALPTGAADSLRAVLANHEDGLSMPHRAELAWLDGLLATTRNRPEVLADARRRLRTLAGNPPVWNTPLVVRPAEVAEARAVVIARMFDTSLHAFELALGGDARRAGELLAELERQRAEHEWTRGVARLHPYLTGINRLAAARWLRESGRPADAERLLRWSEGVEFPGYLVSEARALLDAPVYYERALAAEALGRADVARSHYAQFLRRYDSPIHTQRDLVDRAARSVREAPRNR